MDKKLLTVNQTNKANKQPKNKKNKPVKVKYITNPIKFKTSASEFRSLVQELTGQDAADMPPELYSPRFTEAVGGGEAVVKVVEDHAPAAPIGAEVSRRSSDDVGFGAFGDGNIYPTQMVDNSQDPMSLNQWHEISQFDVFKSLDTM